MPNPIPINGAALREFRRALIAEDTCPECLGELDTGGECNSCDYDAWEELNCEQ